MISADRIHGRRGRLNRGFTLLELVVVITIISVLFVFAIERLLRLEVEAERVAMQQVIGALQSALAMEISAHVARDNIKGLDKLVSTNPMDRLSEAPHNYLGALAAPDAAKIEKGQWYYDQTGKVLIYKVKNEEYFKTELIGPGRVRLQISPVFDDKNNNDRFDQHIDLLKGLKIQPIESYKWLVKPLSAEQ